MYPQQQYPYQQYPYPQQYQQNPQQQGGGKFDNFIMNQLSNNVNQNPQQSGHWQKK